MSACAAEFNAPLRRWQEAASRAVEVLAAGRHTFARCDDDAGPPWRVDLHAPVGDREEAPPPFARALVHADGRVEPLSDAAAARRARPR